LLCGTAMSARADIVFNFNSLSASSGNNSTNIANYMDGLLGCSGCVTVTGAATDTTYNGDGHVVGPGGTSLTLGDSNGATSNSSTTPGSTDTFLSNVTNSGGTFGSNEITITFSTPVTLKGFDYEIFPDASCQSQRSCSSLPDFTFDVNGSTQIFSKSGVFPSSGGSNGSSTESPDSSCWYCGTEQSAQYIGTWSGTLTNVTSLSFIDWPAAIGVDNIDILNPSPVPEPRGAAILLAGLLLIALAAKKIQFSKS